MGSLRVGLEGVYRATLVCGILGRKLDGFFAGKTSGYTARRWCEGC